MKHILMLFGALGTVSSLKLFEREMIKQECHHGSCGGGEGDKKEETTEETVTEEKLQDVGLDEDDVNEIQVQAKKVKLKSERRAANGAMIAPRPAMMLRAARRRRHPKPRPGRHPKPRPGRHPKPRPGGHPKPRPGGNGGAGTYGPGEITTAAYLSSKLHKAKQRRDEIKHTISNLPLWCRLLVKRHLQKIHDKIETWINDAQNVINSALQTRKEIALKKLEEIASNLHKAAEVGKKIHEAFANGAHMSAKTLKTLYKGLCVASVVVEVVLDIKGFH